MFATFSADHDDNDGCFTGRSAAGARDGNGSRTSQAAGHYDCRRPDFQPDADAVYDTRGLSLYGSDASRIRSLPRFTQGAPASSGCCGGHELMRTPVAWVLALPLLLLVG